MRIPDAVIEQGAEAFWNTRATMPWSQIPEEWKPYYREGLINALQAMGPVARLRLLHNVDGNAMGEPQMQRPNPDGSMGS
jgi:hypothetical protein